LVWAKAPPAETARAARLMSACLFESIRSS
jgi:hypothetical protein